MFNFIQVHERILSDLTTIKTSHYLSLFVRKEIGQNLHTIHLQSVMEYHIVYIRISYLKIYSVRESKKYRRNIWRL